MNPALMACLAAVLLPLLGALIAGLGGVGRSTAHRVTIACTGISTLLSLLLYKRIILEQGASLNEVAYTWLGGEWLTLEIGFLVDPLSVTMMVVVSLVSWLIHIYTIGYMRDDPGYQRFFSYISLFTFAMLMLVTANNFLQLFFGWEAVGLVSYLLIGFWFKRESAIAANLKAFLVNRVGDFGFIIGIAAVLAFFGSLDYDTVFQRSDELRGAVLVILGQDISMATLICGCLFVGAMGKSAQVPLHVWLPDSMEGPTPISALIHAATMVTAGIFMVARMSPLYELSEVVLNLILIIGAVTALSMGILGIVQHDIKRVIAYSTLSQLGYMTAALGASAYAAAMFHLVTHAFFKALLFLGAGSVIIALHHKQDLRNMGGLYRYMPLTWIAMLAGSLSLIGFPGTAGFYSKEAIIEAMHYSRLPGAGFAAFALTLGVFFTGLYTFRLLFLAFHGRERTRVDEREQLRESPRVVTIPLLVLMVPSLVIGLPLVELMLYGGYFRESITVLPQHAVLATMRADFHGVWSYAAHALLTWPFWLAMAGVAVAAYCYLLRPQLPGRIATAAGPWYRLLLCKYGFDAFYLGPLAGGVRRVAHRLWQDVDSTLIDRWMVNGTAHSMYLLSAVVRRLQTGRLYHYAFMMILGLLLLGLLQG